MFHLDLKEAAKYLGITTQSLRNKFNRNSFSIKDLIIISGIVMTLSCRNPATGGGEYNGNHHYFLPTGLIAYAVF